MNSVDVIQDLLMKMKITPRLPDSIFPYWPKHKRPDLYQRLNGEYARLPINLFLESNHFDGDRLLKLARVLPSGAYIAGGSVTECLNGKKSSDVDIFFNGAGSFYDTYALFTEPLDSNDDIFKGYISDVSKEQLLEWSGEIKVVNLHPVDKNRPVIQLIKMVWYEDAIHVLESFDFTVAQLCLDQQVIVFNSQSLMDIQNNILAVNKWQYPMDAIYRIIKYAKKGYIVTPKLLQDAIAYIQSHKDDLDSVGAKKRFY
jgi:hypothetical protein